MQAKAHVKLPHGIIVKPLASCQWRDRGFFLIADNVLAQAESQSERVTDE